MLALKRIPYKSETVHLLNGDQNAEDYTKINPLQQVPSLKVVDDDENCHILTQSLAIIQFLDENYPENSVFPKDSVLRAKSRAIADSIASGTQPLQNLETLVHYMKPFGQGELEPADRKKVAQFWMKRKLEGLERLVTSTAGKYCVGDEVSIADICLVPQMFNARRFEIDTSNYPKLKEIDDRLQELEIFKVSHPLSVMPDS